MTIQEKIRSTDKDRMFDVLRDFPNQVRRAIEIGENSPLFAKDISSSNFYILGLGGSAIGGDLLRSYAATLDGADHLSINVSRNYQIPRTMKADSVVIASSYSGATEETLSAYDEARQITHNILCITTGGTLAVTAKESGVPVISIPSGYQPRAAIAFSFFPLLLTMIRSGAFTEPAAKISRAALEELLPKLDELSALYSSESDDNTALSLAKKLHGTIPVVYSASERLDAVNLRWRGQIQENAKNLCFGNVLPEMNHNEINGWAYPAALTKNFSVLMLRDPEDHPRVAIRFDALKGLIAEHSGEIIELRGSGKHLLTRMFELIHLADWVSYYMAILNEADPTPVPIIMGLKSRLAEVK